VTQARTDLPEAADAQLLALARSGDSEAFAVVYERHVAAARRLSRELAATPRLADELVAAAFGRMQEAVSRGGGLSSAVRLYVLTAVRQVHLERLHGARGLPPTDGSPLADLGQPLVDPAFAGLETALMSRAYQSLPERSRAVLWHTEIEHDSPAQIAPLLGVTGNGVAALRRRAMDDLRQAYLQMHMALITQPGCRPVAERLGAFDRRSLSARDAALVSEHLARCEGCQAVHRELTDMTGTVRDVIAPLILGPAAARYLADAGQRAGGVTTGQPRPAGPVVRTLPAAAGLGVVGGIAGGIGGGGSGLSPAGTPGANPPGRHTAPLATSETALPPGPDLPRRSPRGHRRPVWRSRRRTHWSRRAAAVSAGGVVLVVIAATALAVTLSGNDNPPASAGQQPPPPSHQATATATQPSPSPSPSPQPSLSSPSPSPAAPVAAPIRLTASLSVSGHSFFVHVMFQVANTGSTASGPLTAVITVPAAASFSFGGDMQQFSADHGNGSPDGIALPFSDGWSCQQTSGGAICSHAALPAGQQTQGNLFVTVNGSEACGQTATVTVTGGTTVAASDAIRC